ncbi:MAG TPA: cell division protein FtsA, partial [Dissulfurispiraceae bacterium]|nr:cell division protein FtsA [Dissulfurispiraceae bacterium]
MMERRKRANGGNIIVGLDAGTTKICSIMGEVSEEGIAVLAVSSHPSNGLKKGVVIDIEATANSIKKAVAEIEEMTGTSVREVYVGIAGSHIKSFNSYGAVGVKGKEVSHEDVERAIDSASAVYVPLDREILHVLPTEFILDGQDGIKDPVGMAGVRLEVKVYIVTGAVASVQNLLKCCERAGLEVVDIVLQPLASAEATLTSYERDMGVMLVDIGGGTTDMALYKDGGLRHTTVLGIGGNHFTNDLSVGLKLPFPEAERIKKKYGTVATVVPSSEMNDMTEVDVVAIDGQVRTIPRKYISEILQPRSQELLELIRHEMQAFQRNGVAVSGVVFAGGSSLLSGFDRMAEAILSMPVRIGYPVQAAHEDQGHARDHARILGLKGEFNTPVNATGIGLILYGAEASMPLEGPMFPLNVFNKIVAGMAGWFRKILR